MTVEEWLGKDNQIGIDIWNEKYRDKDTNETHDQWVQRVSGGNAEVAQAIINKEFLFGGRILANRGLNSTGRKITYSNCYVLSLDDSIESIFDTARDLARTFSYGGGVGIDIGNLAPRGAKVNNAAKTTSGAVSFMDLYSAVTGLIGQSGRRGALMISIPVNHPDIEEFITVKEDLERVTKANISVRITDEFMECVKSNAPFKLYHRRESTGEETIRWVNARDLFGKLAKCNWNTGEPGILFWDKIEAHNFLNTYDNFKFAGVNPCFTGDMELLTKDGYKRFDELNGKCVDVVNIDGDISVGKVWDNGVKETVKIIFADGSNITCTPDHVFMTIDGDERRAKDLKGTRVMPYTSYKNSHNPLFLKLGYIQGDGQLADVVSHYKQKIAVNIGNKDGDIQDLFSNEEFTKSGSRAIYVGGFNEDIIRLGFSCETLPTRIFPSTYETWNVEEKSAFLCGCYSANGSVVKGSRISYKTTCKDFADSLVKTLQSDFGIVSYITTNKSKPVEFKNGTYTCRESYDVNIGQQKDIRAFAQKINFYQAYKRTHLKKLIECRAPYVYDVIQNGDETVYDFSEPIRHWGVVNGFVAHNCAEEPLPAGGSCLLGSLNLSAFVKKEFEPDAEFDVRRFETVVRSAVVALNEVLDEGLPLHPLKIQQSCVHDWRQIGLGIMGLGDALIKLGITYGSQKAIDFSQKVSTSLLHSSILASSELAKQHGSFPMFDVEKTLASSFGKNLPDYIKQSIRINGLRNSQILTIAPTGTLSTMLGISSGIEPLFAISYTRKTESLHGKDEYYKINVPIAQSYLDLKQVENLPSFFVGASDISIKDRISMQSAWQNNIDASISSTVNLPENTSTEDIESLYMSAWESGLKGITVFRDNCKRVGILTKGESKEEKKEVVIPRGFIVDVPDELTYRKYKIQSGCGKLYLFVGVDETERKIYDVFTNTDGTGGCSINTQANSRLLSACVRGGIPIEYVIEQLQKAGTCPSYQYARGSGKKVSPGKSCPSAMAKILQQIIDEFADDAKEIEESFEDEDEELSIEIPASECPECKNKTLYHEGGCIICKSCGYSKCS